MKLERFPDGQTPPARLSALRELAATQPVPDPRMDDDRTLHEQFAGEYYRRFPEIKRVRTGEATDAEVFYVRMVKERFGYDLIDFYDRNQELCEAICDAVAAKEPYDSLAWGYRDVHAEEAEGRLPLGSTQALQESVRHPAGIEAIGMYYWDQINPLLQQAYQIMNQEMLNAPFLTR